MLCISHFFIWLCCVNFCFEWIFAITDGVSSDDRFVRDSSNGISLLPQNYFGSFMRKKRDLKGISRNRCELKLVADYDFFRVIGSNNYASAARYIVNMIERVNGIFAQVDWGIDINGFQLINLGFSIKEIKIFERPTSISPVHFNSISSGRDDGSFSSLDVLKSFSMEEGTNATCLTVLISAKTFDYGVLGMANIGHAWERGICATVPLNGTFMNTAVITVRRKSELMITRVVDLVAAHELGHAWGSFHDDSADDECVPPNSQNGRYVMHESSNTGYDQNNYNFSPCSIKSIHKVLYEVAYNCFVEDKSALCGNGILEAGEECDGGGQLSKAEGGGDACCTARCRLRPTAVCSPRHAECCTDTCQYAATTALCSARNADTCKRAAYCAGNSSKCPEPLSIKDGTDCMDEGKCLNGECIAFCQRILPNSAPCICEKVSESCQRCCRSSTTGQCRPVHPVRYLSEGSICIHGQCHNNVCEKKVTDNDSLLSRIFNKLNTTPNEKFFADYFVFIIIFISLLIWFPCGALIVYNDQKRYEQMLQKNMEEEVYVVSTTKRLTN